MINEHVMHHLGLEVNGLVVCKTRMANNTIVHCVGMINGLEVKSLGTEVVV